MKAKHPKHAVPSKAIVSEQEAFDIIETYAPDVQLLEVISDTYADPTSLEYHQTHEVPGFFQISSDRFEEAPTWNLRSNEEIVKVLEEYAITPYSDTRIILFDNIQIACGTVISRFDASARVYSIFKYFGVKHVSVIMDNAMNADFEDEFAENHPEIVQEMSSNKVVDSKWSETAQQTSALETTTQELEYESELMARSSKTFQKRIQVRTGQHAELTKNLYDAPTSDMPLLHPPPIEWPQAMIKQAPAGADEIIPYESMVMLIEGKLGSYRLLDARSAVEHSGHVTGYEYVTASGKIPTSESVPNSDFQISSDEDVASVLARLVECLEAKDIIKDDHVIWYCGTGWRAARMCALTQMAGYEWVSIYEGGWNE